MRLVALTAIPRADGCPGSPRPASSADDLRALVDQLDLLTPVVADLLGMRADIDRGLARFEAYRRALPAARGGRTPE